MSIKNIIGISVLLIANFANAQASNNFSGMWCWENESKSSDFDVLIKRVSDVYVGDYTAVAFRGRRTA